MDKCGTGQFLWTGSQAIRRVDTVPIGSNILYFNFHQKRLLFWKGIKGEKLSCHVLWVKVKGVLQLGVGRVGKRFPTDTGINASGKCVQIQRRFVWILDPQDGLPGIFPVARCVKIDTPQRPALCRKEGGLINPAFQILSKLFDGGRTGIGILRNQQAHTHQTKANGGKYKQDDTACGGGSAKGTVRAKAAK